MNEKHPEDKNEEFVDILNDQIVNADLFHSSTANLFVPSFPDVLFFDNDNNDDNDDDQLALATLLSISEHEKHQNSLNDRSIPKHNVPDLPRISAFSTPTTTISRKRKRREKPKIPSHNTRWTEDEDQKLIAGVNSLGYGRWSHISKTIGTRSSTQCKNRGRLLLGLGKITQVPPPLNDPSNEKSEDISTSAHPVNLVEHEETTLKSTDDHESLGSSLDKEDGEESMNDDKEDKEEKDEESEDFIDILDCDEDEVEVEGNVLKQDEMSISSLSSDSSSDDEQKAIEILSSLESSPLLNLKYFPAEHSSPIIPPPQSPSPSPSPPPSIEKEKENHFLPPQTITKDEFESIPFWFPTSPRPRTNHPLKNSQTRSPERYLRIRNAIIEKYNSAPGNYLTKRSARDHIHEGDVNAIGKVYDYLLSRGFINHSVDDSTSVTSTLSPTQQHRKRTYSESETKVENSEMPTFEISIGKKKDLPIVTGKRQRRVRDPLKGGWMDEKLLEGRTISHIILPSDPKPTIPKRKQQRTIRIGEEDPFELIPCLTSSEITSLYPSLKHLILSASLTKNVYDEMERHSKSKDTEVIGLLGGKLEIESEDQQDTIGKRCLRIDMIYSCIEASQSSDIQCEMDSMTELKAKEYFSDFQREIVGWYHSHPTFEVSPSNRDVETQRIWQCAFRREDGFEPFVGIIISPRNQWSQRAGKSQVEVVHVIPKSEDSVGDSNTMSQDTIVYRPFFVIE